MILKYLHKDIVKYILNLYLDYENVVPILVNICNFNFDITPHIQTIVNPDGAVGTNTYLDGIIFKDERFWSNGKKMHTKNFKNGKSQGEYISWFKNGKFAVYLNYENGKIEGKCYKYNRKSDYCVVTKYKSGLRNGEEIIYMSDYSIKSVKNYKNNILNGYYVEYYENKKTKFIRCYHKGIRVGICYIYYDNGNIMKKTHYNEEKLESNEEKLESNKINTKHVKYQLFYDINGENISEDIYIRNDIDMEDENQWDAEIFLLCDIEI